MSLSARCRHGKDFGAAEFAADRPLNFICPVDLSSIDHSLQDLRDLRSSSIFQVFCYALTCYKLTCLLPQMHLADGNTDHPSTCSTLVTINKRFIPNLSSRVDNDKLQLAGQHNQAQVHPYTFTMAEITYAPT